MVERVLEADRGVIARHAAGRTADQEGQRVGLRDVGGGVAPAAQEQEIVRDLVGDALLVALGRFQLD